MRRATVLAGLIAITIAAVGMLGTPRAEAEYSYGAMVDYDLVFPVVGENNYVESFYAPRYNGIHHAVDIMSDKMTPVVAVASGTIYYVNGTSNPNWNGGRCCTLRLRHDDGWTSVYIHLNNDTPGTDDGQGWGIADGIEIGTRVEAGQLIGWVGDSGNAETTPPHLHFELHDPDGVHVNPYAALRVAEGKPAPAIDPPAQCDPVDDVDVDEVVSGSTLLRSGSRGEAVRQLQAFLENAGYDPGPVDGVFGPKTGSAVEAFQRSRGLTADGVVGPMTRAAIQSVAVALPASPVLDTGNRIIRPGYTGSDVRSVQELLELAGHDPGPIDGVYGPKTQAAVSDFQRAQGDLTVDGKVGPNTRKALAAALGFGNIDAVCR
jgi:peptidoglycan hydrolase-like protein with peptidoglycan-binding domain